MALFLLVLVAIALILGFWGWKTKRQILELFAAEPAEFKRSHIKKYIIAGCLLIFLIIALVSPQFSSGSSNSLKTGEIIFLLDGSQSMQAAKSLDSPTRLERAKLLALKTIGAFPEAKFSPHWFTTYTISLTPFTQDQEYLKRSINRAYGFGDLPGTGTSFGRALLDVADKFSDNEEAKIIIIFSDGEPFYYRAWLDPNEENELNDALSKLIQKNIKVIAVGIGEKSGARIPLYNEEGIFTGDYATLNDIPYISYLQEEILRKIASFTKGKYFTEADIQGLISYLGQNLRMGNAVGTKGYYNNINPLFLLPAIVLWIIFARYYLR